MNDEQETLWLCFAVNDDNGVHTGRATAFDFGDLLTLAYWDFRGITCYLLPGNALKISRRRFPILSYGAWIGNMAWDGARVTVETANQIAEYLRSLERFTCEMGESGLYDAWYTGEPIRFEGLEGEFA